MLIEPLVTTPLLSATDYRCTAGPADAPFVEMHRGYSVSYVRKGNFGLRSRGRSFDLVAGSLLIGRPGDEYLCTHEHHGCGDECLSFELDPELVELIGDDADAWQMGAMPPIEGLAVLGELAQATVEGKTDLAIDEVGMWLTARFVTTASEMARTVSTLPERDRRRAALAALWLDQHSAESIDLARVAKTFELSPFHFLRLFSRAVGATPHQYLTRCRIRRAVRLLAEDERTITDIAFEVGFGDLSNFERTFRRAAGVSARAFRKAARGDRKILRDPKWAVFLE